MDRSSTSNVKLYQCFPDASSCLASYTAMDTICQVGYYGPLCQTCVKNYAKYGGIKCSPCYSKIVNYLIISLTFLGFTIFIFVYLK